MPEFLQGELSDAERRPDTARFRVIPVPLERTVSYGAGTAGGPSAILTASAELERHWRGVEPCAAGIATEPALDCTGAMETVMERLAERTAAAVTAGAVPVVLGGEHSLTYGAVQGVRRALGRGLGVVQIDAHADLRLAYLGERHSHASVMHLLAEEAQVPLAQFGVRALSTEEAEARRRLGIAHHDAEALVTGRTHAVTLPDGFPRDVYVSFDLDGLDPAVLPATGTPVPGGLDFWQAVNIVRSALTGRRLVGLDVVELAPDDRSRVSDFTAAQVTYALMAMA